MKLEEVLPAMRDGRVAVDKDGDRCRLIGEHFCQWVERLQMWCAYCAELPLDGWTLEPEPKVEWPKGSYQWAAEQVPCAACFDKHMRRKSTGRYSFESAYDMLALDWEVVP